MTWFDRLVQRWRMEQAKRHIPARARVLDIGCDDAALFKYLAPDIDGVGIDPDVKMEFKRPNIRLIRGFFPADLPASESAPFDAITLLAVLEHIPPDQQRVLAADCFRFLKPNGKLIITVPSPRVDLLLKLLQATRIAHATTLDQHYGYDVNQTPQLFGGAGFKMIRSAKFQLGLNNLFVFQRPAEPAAADSRTQYAAAR